MKLVIDSVTTPLLFARLSAASTPRERAALLRSIAEAALRGEVITSPSRLQTSAEAASAHTVALTRVDQNREKEFLAPMPAVTNDTEAIDVGSAPGFDGNLIGEEFASFF